MWCRAAFLLSLGPGVLLGQGRGSIAGRVTDDSGRAVVAAEVILMNSMVRRYTTASGAFQLDGLRAGSATLLARAIGFRARTIAIEVRADQTTDIGLVQLTRAIQELAPLEVTATLPVPTFSPGLTESLDEGLEAPTLAYAWYGASMTENGVYAIPGGALYQAPNEMVQFRIRDNSPLGERAFASPCYREGAGRVMAISVAPDQLQLLDHNGVAWSTHGSYWSNCERVARFPFKAPLRTAAALPEGWGVVIADSAGPLVGAIDAAGKPQWVEPLSSLLPGLRGDVTLMATPSGLTLATLHSPFRWVEISPAGEVLARGGARAKPDSAGQELRELPRTWRSFGVLAVPNGYVQTVESPDRRLGWHLVYDLQGKPVRWHPRGEISVLVASLPEWRKALGFRYRKSLRDGGQLVLQWY